MKKTWLLLFLLIVVISTTGCSTSSTTTSSTSSNSISPKNTEIAHANFCVGSSEIGNPSIKFEPPLIQVKNDKWSSLQMPLEPGRYKITVTTNTPESIITMGLTWRKIKSYDKFGTPDQYEGGSIANLESNRHADINQEVIIPAGAIGKIFLRGPTGSQSGNCGAIIVTRIM